MNIRLPDEVIERIRREADLAGRSVTAEIAYQLGVAYGMLDAERDLASDAVSALGIVTDRLDHAAAQEAVRAESIERINERLARMTLEFRKMTQAINAKQTGKEGDS